MFLNLSSINISAMKRLYNIGFLVLILCPGIRAQKPIYLFEDSLNMGSSRLPALSVIIPEVKSEITLTNWIKLLETGTKSKVVTESGEMSIFGALSENINTNTVNVYSRLSDQDTLVKLTVSFELKKDRYVEKTTGEAELAKARTLLFNFAREQYIELASEQLSAEDNKLRVIEKELGSLERDETGMKRSLRSAGKTIETENERLIVLRDELAATSAVIADNNRILASMKPGTEKDEKALFIKDLELKKKITLKSISNSERKISKAERTIENATGDIPKIDSNQDKTRARLYEQEALVQKYTDRLNAIKAYR